MSGFVWAVLGVLSGFGLAAIGDMVSEEIRDRLDHLPHAVLRLAVRRLDPTQRITIYSGEWLPELTYILKGDEARPVTRLYHGIRYSVGILVTVRSISRYLSRPTSAQLRYILAVRGRTDGSTAERVWEAMVDQIMRECQAHPKMVRSAIARSQGLEIEVRDLAEVWCTIPDGGLLTQALIKYLDGVRPRGD